MPCSRLCKEGGRLSFLAIRLDKNLFAAAVRKAEALERELLDGSWGEKGVYSGASS